MNKIKKGLLLSLFLIPVLVSASSLDSSTPLPMIIFLHAFITPHISLFFLKPLAEMISENDSKKTFWTMFCARIVLIIVLDMMFVPLAIFMCDFFSVFIGGMIVVPIVAKAKGKSLHSLTDSSSGKTNMAYMKNEPVTSCPNCGNELKPDEKFCTNCGSPIVSYVQTPTTGKLMVYGEFDPMYRLTEDKLLEEFIKKEMGKADVKLNNMIPSAILKRKNIFSAILATLVFVFLSMIFFHFPIITYVLGLIIIIVFLIITRKYDLMDYIKKEVKSRPSEKISNIVMSIKNTLVVDSSKKLRLISVIVALLAPLIVFYKPVILYEPLDNGYAVRYYAFGITEYKTATIPSSHKGKPVISLRGNAFSNMFFLETVTLPDTITEIRGEAFKNDYNLKSVKLPINLEEIKGSSFENCTSLETIDIPDTVTRIGGHAFYNCSSLREVNITNKSMLTEVGSSAFRSCPSLTQITLPAGTYVNERAFKNSPTTVNYYREDGNVSKPVNMYGYINQDEEEEIVLYDGRKIKLTAESFDFVNKVFTLRYNSDEVVNEIFTISKHGSSRFVTSDGIIIDFLDSDKHTYTLTVTITYFE